MDRYPPTEEGLKNWGQYMANHPEQKVTLLRIGTLMYFIVIVHPDEIAKLLCMKPSVLPKDDFMYGVVKAYLGDGLLISNFDKWQTRRRMLTKGFHYDILKPYVLLYNEVVEVFLSKCEGKLKNGETVISVFENITVMTLDVMLQCACSYKSGCQLEQTEDRYINAVKDNVDLALKQVTLFPYIIKPIFYLSPHGFAWRKNCRIVKEQTLKIVQSRRESLVENPNLVANKPNKDFIDILLTSKDSSGNGLADEGIVEEMTTFLFEGHDTTASAISWTLHLLGAHAKYQAMCREEVRRVLNGRNSDTIQWEDLSNLTFLTMCIKESMRLFTPVNDIYRMAHEDMHMNGYFIPKGSRFLLSIGGLHRNPNVWENPLEYNPMRFDCELPGGHPFAFIPFSAGHRNCIGQKFAFNELLVAIGRIINKFEIESLTKEPRRVIPIIVKPEEDLKIRLKLSE
ncbi:Cytochrome P450 4F4 [Oopsacas minuta]|uniref:Cytochrome P450 4F4 n=1 Tax=Oopsacas minuta TaxID=111878 RepID=A0AAV7JSE0_9METZ|nr:Cytochrome P450 4F4 [Oopsacas minuta]